MEGHGCRCREPACEESCCRGCAFDAEAGGEDGDMVDADASDPSSARSTPPAQERRLSAETAAPAADDGAGCREMPHLRCVAHRPKTAWCAACGVHCLLFAAWIALVAAVPAFFPFSPAVPIHLRGEVHQRRTDAVRAGRKAATYSIGDTGSQLRRSVTVDEAGDDLAVEVLYIAPAGASIYSAHLLQQIRDVEREILSTASWKGMCALDWGGVGYRAAAGFAREGGRDPDAAAMHAAAAVPCRPPESAMWGCMCPAGSTVTFKDGVARCGGGGGGGGCSVSAGELASSADLRRTLATQTNFTLTSYPPGLLDCRRPAGCHGDGTTSDLFEPLNPAYVQAAVRHYRAAGDADYAAQRFAGGVMDVAGDRALRSVFRLGLPLDGFPSADVDQDAQVEAMADRLYADIHPLLFGRSGEVSIWFRAPRLEERYKTDQVVRDGLWAVGALAFVWCYVAMSAGSWFLATAGVGQVVMSFAPAYGLYYAVGFRYFGTFNVLTLFIVLGIGADDVFVSLEMWNHSGAIHPADGVTAEQRRHRRLSHVFVRGGKAMLVTSATTIASFMCTGASSFPGIRSFGVFAALVVFANYCSVMTYFPTALAAHDAVFTDGCPSLFCCGVRECWRRADACLPDACQRSRQMSIPVFKVYAAVLLRCKRSVAAAVLGVVVWLTVAAAGIEADPEPPRVLPLSNNYGGFDTVKAQHFSRGSDSFSVWLQITIGIDPVRLVDRTGTTDAPDSIGEPVWSEWVDGVRRRRPEHGTFGIDLVPEGLPCFEELARLAAVPSDERGVPPGASTRCWVTAFREWLGGGDGSHSMQPTAAWPDISGKAAGFDYDGDGEEDGAAWWAGGGWQRRPKPPGHAFAFRDNLRRWLADASVYDRWRPHLLAEKVEACVRRPPCSTNYTGCCDGPECACGPAVLPRFSTAELPLAVPTRVDYKTGARLSAAWDEWLASALQSPACRDVCRGGAENGADPPCAAPIFVTDRAGVFAFFELQRVMVREALVGIGASLALALAVICVATGNWWVACMATATIGAIVSCVIGVTAVIGWKLGVIQSIIFVMVPGMSVDYVAHLADAYASASTAQREDRVAEMLVEVGPSVVYGALSTVGASVFLLAPVIAFFNTFGVFLLVTVLVSLMAALLLFPSLLALAGPEGGAGGVWVCWQQTPKRVLQEDDASPTAHADQRSFG